MSVKRSASESDTPASPAKRHQARPPKHHAIKHRQPGSLYTVALPQDNEIIQCELERAICLGLQGVGFDTVGRDALESFRSLVDSYMINFSQRLALSMRSGRRTKPTPADFSVTLAQHGLTPASLLPDLSVPVPTAVSQRPILESSSFFRDSEEAQVDANQILSKQMGGMVDEKDKNWIPKHFPDFPSIHTYRFTPVITQREEDARKIREISTKEGMLAEQALRRLMVARQQGSKKRSRPMLIIEPSHQASTIAQHKMEQKRREDSDRVFQDALGAAVQKGGSDRGQGGFLDDFDGAADQPGDKMVATDVDFGATVNYDKAFWRKSAREFASV